MISVVVFNVECEAVLHIGQVPMLELSNMKDEGPYFNFQKSNFSVILLKIYL